MEVRMANEQDMEAISKMVTAIWKAYYPAIITHEQIDFMLDKMCSVQALHNQLREGHIFMVAEEDNEIAGYIAFYPVNEKEVFLDKLYVKLDMHGRNIGGILLNEMMEQTGEDQQIKLQVNRKNIKAINFYFKSGFRIERAADFDIGNGFFMNDFVMIKNQHHGGK